MTRNFYHPCTERCLPQVYYVLFRIGEITSGSHPVLAKDVHIALNKNKLLFMLRSLKTHTKGTFPQSVKITSTRKAALKYCPFDILRVYLTNRPDRLTDEEPFFVFCDHSPVKLHQLNLVLKTILRKCNVTVSLYSMPFYESRKIL